MLRRRLNFLRSYSEVFFSSPLMNLHAKFHGMVVMHLRASFSIYHSVEWQGLLLAVLVGALGMVVARIRKMAGRPWGEGGGYMLCPLPGNQL